MKNFILFDFDGVIADTFAPAFEVQKLIYSGITEDDYRTFFEGNINEGGNTPTHSKLAANFHPEVDFFTEYLPRLKKEGKVFSGMIEVIKKLSESYSLIIVSSTITTPIQEFLEENNLTPYFTEIMGNDIHASKVEKIKMIFDKYNTTKEHCVFVTDTLGDMVEAEKTGMGAIGVSWGFHDQGRLLRGNPFRIVNAPDELIDAVSDFFN